jgi:Protein tyrosine and serine/threonine kinase
MICPLQVALYKAFVEKCVGGCNSLDRLRELIKLYGQLAGPIKPSLVARTVMPGGTVVQQQQQEKWKQHLVMLVTNLSSGPEARTNPCVANGYYHVRLAPAGFPIQEDAAFTNVQWLQLAYDVLCALAFMHSRSIGHSDVRLPNIIIKEGGPMRFCLVDLEEMRPVPSNPKDWKHLCTVPEGSSVVMQAWGQNHEAVHLSKKESPEETFTINSDVWCVGHMLLEGKCIGVREPVLLELIEMLKGGTCTAVDAIKFIEEKGSNGIVVYPQPRSDLGFFQNLRHQVPRIGHRLGLRGRSERYVSSP